MRFYTNKEELCEIFEQLLLPCRSVWFLLGIFHPCKNPVTECLKLLLMGVIGIPGDINEPDLALNLTFWEQRSHSSKAFLKRTSTIGGNQIDALVFKGELG